MFNWTNLRYEVFVNRVTALCLFVLWTASASVPLMAQSGNESNAHAWRLPRLFPRREAPTTTETPARQQPLPTPLRVIDRPRAAAANQPNTVETAAFQQPAPRVYRTPPTNPYAQEYNPYDPAFQSNYPFPATPYQELPAPTEMMYLPPATMLPSDNSSGQLPPPREQSTLPSVLPQQPQWESLADGPQDPVQSSTPPLGQGYLQHGTGFQGRRLNPQPITATERALELIDENQRLRDALGRAQRELEVRESELIDARTANQEVANELRQALQQVKELNRHLIRMASELNLAIEDRNNIERRANEQLQAIEAMLDSLLVDSFSDQAGRQ